MKTITNITYPAFALFVCACFALAPQARAVCQKGCLADDNTVLGDDALSNNTIGFENTAVGSNALLSNTAGEQNTAIGFSALLSNISGYGNTAIGLGTLHDNLAGGFNTANGANALYHNTGDNNTAIGFIALLANTTGGFNTATGGYALNMNISGDFNTAYGYNALFLNRNGTNNIALGASAGQNLTTGNNNIYIGNPGGGADESKKIRIGIAGGQNAAFIAGISGGTVPDGVGVIVGTNGKLGTVVSSARFKDEIKPMDKASEAILALRPVTFRYKRELDSDGIPQFGLVAEEVEKVNPDLVARDHQGKPYTVRYEAVNTMLLNEFLKEYRKVQELEANAAKQQKQIEALTAGLQKVSAQLELSKHAPETVSNSH